MADYMATFTITIPNTKVTNIVDALCTNYGYQETKEGVPNTETKQQFAKRMILEFIRGNYKQNKIEADAVSARNTSASTADNFTSDITIT